MNKPCFYDKRGIFRALPVLQRKSAEVHSPERKKEREGPELFFLKVIYLLFIIIGRKKTSSEYFQRRGVDSCKWKGILSLFLCPGPKLGYHQSTIKFPFSCFLPSFFLYFFLYIFFRTLRVPMQGSECRDLKSRNHYPLGRRVLLRHLVLA